MTTTRLVDFDAFRSEQERDPVTLKIGGQNYDLPSSLPASVAVTMIHLQSTLADENDVPVEVLDSMGKAIFGSDLWTTVLDVHRIQVDELPELIKMVLAVYSGPTPVDPPKASTRVTKRSSSGS